MCEEGESNISTNNFQISYSPITNYFPKKVQRYDKLIFKISISPNVPGRGSLLWSRNHCKVSPAIHFQGDAWMPWCLDWTRKNAGFLEIVSGTNQKKVLLWSLPTWCSSADSQYNEKNGTGLPWCQCPKWHTVKGCLWSYRWDRYTLGWWGPNPSAMVFNSARDYLWGPGTSRNTQPFWGKAIYSPQWGIRACPGTPWIYLSSIIF